MNKTTGKRNFGELRELHRAGWIFLVPIFALLTLITLYPLLHVIWLSLHRNLIIFQISEFIGFSNFIFLAEDGRFIRALGNTLYFAVLSVSIELVLGLLVALLLARITLFRGLVLGALLLPWAVPTVVSARLWEWMFHSNFGVINYILGLQQNWLGHPQTALHAAIVADIWKSTPFVALLLLAALKAIPKEVYAAAEIDGASPFDTFRRITLPLLAPALCIVALLRFLDAIRVFDVVYVLTGGGPAGTTETLAIYAYKLFFQTLQFGYGSAVALSIFFLAATAAILLGSIARRFSV